MLLNWVGVSLIAQQPVQLRSLSSQRDSSRLMIICVHYICDYMAAANRTRTITVGQRTQQQQKISDDLIDRLSDCAAFTHFIAHKSVAMIRNKRTCWHSRHMPSEVNNSIMLVSSQASVIPTPHNTFTRSSGKTRSNSSAISPTLSLLVHCFTVSWS